MKLLVYDYLYNNDSSGSLSNYQTARDDFAIFFTIPHKQI